ncbi:MAG: hypothetical protein BMS9Abin36_0835 [Gammaproteobacteria bacterium]|nr:MAG: hypothetical protein BMS9Abin36_0835 [Gammaproteobacteria bacterium]
MKFCVQAGILFVLIGINDLALAETGKAPDPAAAKRGEPLYQQYCQSCHGVKGVGEPAPPVFLRRSDYFPAPALNDSQHAWHHSDENILRTIMNGSPRVSRMPAWKGKITVKQAQDIIAYMKSLWGKRALDCQGPKHMSCM